MKGKVRQIKNIAEIRANERNNVYQVIEKEYPDLLIRECWLRQYIPSGREMFIDIGTHRGEWAKTIGKEYKKVIAFEPNEEARKKFEQVPLNTYLRKEALWDSAGERWLFSYGETPHSSMIFECGGINTGKTISKTLVKTTTLDIVTQDIETIDFIKIDVEGAEPQVIKGGMATLKKHKPTLIIENHTLNGRLFLESVMKQLGYTVTIVYHPFIAKDDLLRETHIWLVCKKNK